MSLWPTERAHQHIGTVHPSEKSRQDEIIHVVRRYHRELITCVRCTMPGMGERLTLNAHRWNPRNMEQN